MESNNDVEREAMSRFCSSVCLRIAMSTMSSWLSHLESFLIGLPTSFGHWVLLFFDSYYRWSSYLDLWDTMVLFLSILSPHKCSHGIMKL